MSTFLEKEQNWWKCSSFLEKIVQLLLQTRVDTRNYECVNFVDKQYQIDVPIFQEFSNFKNVIRDQTNEISLFIYIFCENPSTSIKNLCEIWEISCDLITPKESLIVTQEIEVAYLKKFISIIDALPALKLSTTIRSSPNQVRMNFDMNPHFQLNFEPRNKIGTTFFPTLRSEFGSLSMKVVYDENCSIFSVRVLLQYELLLLKVYYWGFADIQPKFLDNFLLSGSYMQNDQVRPANQQNQLIHKQREEDPVFLKFLQSSCPIELLNSASPINPELMRNARTFYEKNLCN